MRKIFTSFSMVLLLLAGVIMMSSYAAPPILVEEDDSDEQIASPNSSTNADANKKSGQTSTPSNGGIMFIDEDELEFIEAQNREKARRDSIAAAEKKAREDSIAAAKAAEKERKDSIARAEQERKDSLARAEQERKDSIARAEQERKDSLARAEKERQDSIAAAKAAEKERQDSIARAEQERKDSIARAEQERKDSIARAEQERKDSIAAAKAAEKERQDSIARAEQERKDSIARAEKERQDSIAAAKAAEKERQDRPAAAKAAEKERQDSQDNRGYAIQDPYHPSASSKGGSTGTSSYNPNPDAEPTSSYSPAKETSVQHTPLRKRFYEHSGSSALSIVSAGYSTYFLFPGEGVNTTKDLGKRHLINFSILEWRAKLFGMSLFNFEMGINTPSDEPGNRLPKFQRGGVNEYQLLEADPKTMWFAYKPAMKVYIPLGKMCAIQLYGGVEVDLTKAWSKINTSYYEGHTEIPEQNFFFGAYGGTGFVFTAVKALPLEVKAEYRHPLRGNVALVPQGFYLSTQLHIAAPIKAKK